MIQEQVQTKRVTEASLIVVCGALTLMLYLATGYKMVILNLFYLPVVLAAFYLGLHRAGALAFFCVMLGTVVAASDLNSFAGEKSQLVIGTSLLVWAGVMGLNALFVGKLSDERNQKIEELHDAYLGVVEVLSQYLKSAVPGMNDRSKRVADLCQKVARRMRLSDREIDDITVATLLQDIEHIEVTAKVIHRAVGDLKNSNERESHTFHGGDLVQSLGSVLTGSFPMILSPSDALQMPFDEQTHREEQIGTAIIRAARRYDALINRAENPLSSSEAIKSMQVELDGDYHPGVLSILETIGDGAGEEPADKVAQIEHLVQSV